MRFFTAFLATLAVTAFAAPAADLGLSKAIELEKRQTATTSNEFTRFGCRNVLFFFARGSTEPGNMVSFQCSLICISDRSRAPSWAHKSAMPLKLRLAPTMLVWRELTMQLSSLPTSFRAGLTQLALLS